MSPAPFGLSGLRRGTLGLAWRHNDWSASRLVLRGRGDERYFDGALDAGLALRLSRFADLAVNWSASVFRTAGGAASWRHIIRSAARLPLLEHLHFY